MNTEISVWRERFATLDLTLEDATTLDYGKRSRFLNMKIDSIEKLFIHAEWEDLLINKNSPNYEKRKRLKLERAINKSIFPREIKVKKVPLCRDPEMKAANEKLKQAKKEYQIAVGQWHAYLESLRNDIDRIKNEFEKGNQS